MSEGLELTKNMQFYKTKKSLNDNILSNVLDQAVSNKEQGKDFIIDVYRDIRSISNDVEYKVTIKVFPTEKPVYFLKDSDLKDRIFAYIILLELDDYLIVMSKSCANFSQLLNNNFDLVLSQELSKLLGKDAEFQKLSLRNMTISDKAVRNRSYEAVNLKGTLSTHAAGRSIPSHIKVRDGGNIKSISGTGRIVESSTRQPLDDIVKWIHEQIKLLQTANSNEFLNLFARKVQLVDVLKVTKPAALLVDVSFIEDELLSGNIKIKWQTSRKVRGQRKKKIIEKYIKENVKVVLLDELRKVYEIDANNNIIEPKNKSKLKVNSKSLSISTKAFKNFKIEENNKAISLISYINKKGLYSITFDDPKYMYFIDHCFEDVSGVSEVDSILDILVPKLGIDKVINEKGNFRKNQKVFNTNSMFGFVEKLHLKDHYIFCDDLGDEWADHITLNLSDPSINFIHSKHGKKSTSASNLHDVVGQGLKNLGNMFFSNEQFIDKINKTMYKSYISSSGVKTNIPRIRKSNKTLDSDLKNLLKHFQLHRKCILSCSFISKQEIAMEFNKLKSKQKVRGNIIQLLWIISSFSHAAKEANVIPIIYCDT